MLKKQKQITQPYDQFKVNGSKTLPTNTQNQNSPKKHVEFNINKQSPSLQKNPSRELSVEQKAISQQQREFLVMQHRIRRLKQQVDIQIQLAKNRKLYQKLEQQLKAQEEDLKKKKREIIRKRMQEMQKLRKQKQDQQIQSYKKLAHIKMKEKKKQVILQKLLQKNKHQYEQCYQKALKQRKKLREPINFEALISHQNTYKKKQNRHKTQVEQDDTIQKIKSNRFSERYKINNDSTNSKLRYKTIQNQSSDCLKDSRKIKSSVQQYLQTRRKQEKRIQQLKLAIQRRNQYGNIVQVQYGRSRVNTQSKDQKKFRQKYEAQQRAKIIQQRNRILKSMKKPQLPEVMTKNVQTRRLQQLNRISQSGLSPQQKMLKLNMILQAQVHRLKNKRDNTDNFQRLNQINMVRAQLLLNSN